MNRGFVRACAVLAALVLIMAGCAQRADKAPPAAPIPVAPPMPPPGAGMHDGLSTLKAVWHMRAAVNVAALSCGARDGRIVGNYNQLLSRHKTVLAAAYATETDVARAAHGAGYQRALDTHMTQLFNYFAWPPAQDAFCREAALVAAEAGHVQPAQFETFAVRGLRRIDAVFTAPPAPRIAAVPAAPHRSASAAAPAVAAGVWRIQVGAFTGRRAAEAAWRKVRVQSPALAAYAPHYEPVPRRPELVRLQLAAGADRASALRLCALASAAGFDCLPVGG